jgi:hypothetical protein
MRPLQGNNRNSDNTHSTATAFTVTPQARITLVSGTPVMATSQTNVATVFVTPFGGNIIPTYDGVNMNPTPFAEVSQAISDATKSPAAPRRCTDRGHLLLDRLWHKPLHPWLCLDQRHHPLRQLWPDPRQRHLPQHHRDHQWRGRPTRDLDGDGSLKRWRHLGQLHLWLDRRRRCRRGLRSLQLLQPSPALHNRSRQHQQLDLRSQRRMASAKWQRDDAGLDP